MIETIAASALFITAVLAGCAILGLALLIAASIHTDGWPETRDALIEMFARIITGQR